MAKRSLAVLLVSYLSFLGYSADVQAGANYPLSVEIRGPSIGQQYPPVGDTVFNWHDNYNYGSTRWGMGNGASGMRLVGEAETHSVYVVGSTNLFGGGAHWDDVVFSCPNSFFPIDAALNINVDASATFALTAEASQITPMGRVEIEISGMGTWRAESNYGGVTVPEPVSTGVFAGSSGDGVSLLVAYPLGQVPLDVPVTIDLGAVLIVESRNSLVGGDLFMTKAANGPVFVLPPGCTCNSVQMGVYNNGFGPNAVENTTWGRVKSLYR